MAKKTSNSGNNLLEGVFFFLPSLGVKSQEQREGVRVSVAGESGRKSRAEKRVLLQQLKKECGVTLRSSSPVFS